jgi:hypothetical protein
MSTLNPKALLAALRECSVSREPFPLSPEQQEWLLAQLKHKDDRIAALEQLVARPSPAAASATPPETICAEADRLVSHDRQAQYGHPSEDFSRTAAMWEALLGLPPGAISPEQVAYCMIALKLSRLTHKYKRDSVVDIAGYAKTASMICEDPV